MTSLDHVDTASAKSEVHIEIQESNARNPFIEIPNPLLKPKIRALRNVRRLKRLSH